MHVSKILITSTLGLLTLATNSKAYTPSPHISSGVSRRELGLLVRNQVVLGTILGGGALPAPALEEALKDADKIKKAELAEKKAAEKEARRIAAETKQRLAAGRIGTI